MTGTSFTKATGSWIEPVVKCNSRADTEWAVFWVGIDGWGSDTVEQIGTYAYCSEGRVQHAAWWEFYPTNDIQTISTMTVKAGDRIATSVTFTGSEFVLEIKDETTGKAFSHTGNAKRPADFRGMDCGIALLPGQCLLPASRFWHSGVRQGQHRRGRYE